MARYTLEQHFEIIQKFYGNKRSFAQIYHSLLESYVMDRPDVHAIRRIMDKFERDLILHDTKPPTRRRNARNPDNIAAVRASGAANADVSVNRRFQEVGLSRMTTWRILKKELGTLTKLC